MRVAQKRGARLPSATARDCRLALGAAHARWLIDRSCISLALLVNIARIVSRVGVDQPWR
jgi:hypothetical protein